MIWDPIVFKEFYLFHLLFYLFFISFFLVYKHKYFISLIDWSNKYKNCLKITIILLSTPPTVLPHGIYDRISFAIIEISLFFSMTAGMVNATIIFYKITRIEHLSYTRETMHVQAKLWKMRLREKAAAITGYKARASSSLNFNLTDVLGGTRFSTRRRHFMH